MISIADVFEYVAEAIQTEKPNTYLTSVYERIPAEFPCVMIRRIGVIRPLQNINLTMDDSQRRISYEVQVVSNKEGVAQSECRELADIVENAFNKIYFIMDMNEPIDEESNNYRIVLRFHRVLGGGEEI